MCIRDSILTVQADNEDGSGNDDQICHKKGVDRAHDLMLDALSVHFMHAHQTRTVSYTHLDVYKRQE